MMDGWMELWNQHGRESSAFDADLALAAILPDFSTQSQPGQW